MKSRVLFPVVTSLMLLVTTMPSFATVPRIDLLGDPVPASASTRTIIITPDTRYVNVSGGDIVKFVVGEKSFSWAFNVGAVVSSFDLNLVAPPGVLDQSITAYVAPDPRYIAAAY